MSRRSFPLRKAWPHPAHWLAIGLLALSACGTTHEGATQQPHEFDDQGIHVITHGAGNCSACLMYRNVAGYVVRLETVSGLEAGVALTSDGIIATNAHVVSRATSVEVLSFEGDAWVGTVVTADPIQDLALVALPETGRTWAPPALHDGPPPPLGTEIYVIGRPVGLGWCVTRGTITGVRRIDGVSMIETDAVLLPGNSGGAMVDASGRLIGIVSSKTHRTEGSSGNTTLARPTASLRAFLEAYTAGMSPR